MAVVFSLMIVPLAYCAAIQNWMGVALFGIGLIGTAVAMVTYKSNTDERK